MVIQFFCSSPLGRRPHTKRVAQPQQRLCRGGFRRATLTITPVHGNCRFSRRNEEPCSSDGCFAPCPNYPRLVIQRSPVYFRTTKDLHP